jgi:hypothetical protein
MRSIAKRFSFDVMAVLVTNDAHASFHDFR